MQWHDHFVQAALKNKSQYQAGKRSLMLKTVYLNDVVVHLFAVDIRFNFNESNTKTLIYNEAYWKSFEKKKLLTRLKDALFN